MPLTREDLARHSGQSVPYYNKLFKKQTNQSPLAYFIQLKTRKACELLDQTDLSVQEIGAKLGYDDPYYFSRLFKKTQECSPTAYRKAVKPGSRNGKEGNGVLYNHIRLNLGLLS